MNSYLINSGSPAEAATYGQQPGARLLGQTSRLRVVVLAWGSSNRFEERKAFVHGLLGSMKHKTLLQTKMHPSRGRYEGFIQPFVAQRSIYTSKAYNFPMQ